MKKQNKRWDRVENISEWFDMENAVYYHGGDKRWLSDKIRWQRLIGSEDTEDMIFGIAEIDPGEYHLLHYHEDCSECYFVLEGRAKFRIDDEVIDGTPGTGLYMPAGSKHAIVNDGKKKLVFFFAYPKPYYKTTLVDARIPDMGD